MVRVSKKGSLLSNFNKDIDSVTINETTEGQFILRAKEDTELRMGRVKIDTGRILNQNLKGIVTSLPDNIKNGLKVNNDIRLMNSEVIPYIAKENETVYVYIKVNDNTLCTLNEGNIMRTRQCYIKKNQAIALLTLIK